MSLKLTETKTQCLKINRNETFRKNRNHFGQISVSNTSTRLQLSAVIQTTRTGTAMCKLVETWIFLLPWKCINFHAKYTGYDNVWTIWFHQTKRVCTEAAAEHYICSLFKRSLSWNVSTVTTHCCITIFQGGKKQFALNMVSDLGLHLKLVTF